MSEVELKSKILDLLEEDREFRLAVAGLIGYREILDKLAEHDEKFNSIMEEIREINERLAEHDEKFNSIMEEIREIRAFMDRVSLTLEEEAREVVGHKLRERGLPVRLERLSLPDLEVDIYGRSGDLCIVGEASTRLGIGLVRRVDGLVREVERRVPEVAGKRIVRVVYTLWATPEAVEEARKLGIWIVEALRELTPFPA